MMFDLKFENYQPISDSELFDDPFERRKSKIIII
jgi:hypothetical protein